MIRLPIEEGATLKSLTDSDGGAISAFAAGMIHEKVKGHKKDAREKAWIAKHLEMNLICRAKADAKPAAGCYKRKRHGCPRKPRPRGAMVVVALGRRMFDE